MRGVQHARHVHSRLQTSPPPTPASQLSGAHTLGTSQAQSSEGLARTLTPSWALPGEWSLRPNGHLPATTGPRAPFATEGPFCGPPDYLAYKSRQNRPLPVILLALQVQAWPVARDGEALGLPIESCLPAPDVGRGWAWRDRWRVGLQTGVLVPDLVSSSHTPFSIPIL